MATDVKNFGAYHMADNPAIYEPARSTTFQFVVTGLDSLLKPGATGEGANDFITDGQSIINYSVTSVNIPNFSIATTAIRRGNSVMKAAGLPTFDDGQIVVNEFEGSDGVAVLYAWQKLAYNPDTDLTGHMADYKKDCYLIQYNVDYSKVIRQYLLKGCWVSAISQDNFNKESDGKRAITATIPFDYAQMILSDEE